MIKELSIKAFQKKHKESDIMGVIRTLYPTAQVTLPKGRKK